MPNKAKSKAQFRLFKGIETGSIPPKGGLTRRKAKEMLGNESPKGLPERLGPAGPPKKLTGRARRPR